MSRLTHAHAFIRIAIARTRHATVAPTPPYPVAPRSHRTTTPSRSGASCGCLSAKKCLLSGPTSKRRLSSSELSAYGANVTRPPYPPHNRCDSGPSSSPPAAPPSRQSRRAKGAWHRWLDAVTSILDRVLTESTGTVTLSSRSRTPSAAVCTTFPPPFAFAERHRSQSGSGPSPR